MPTIGDMYTKDVEVGGAPRHVEIDDTAGQEAYADLKKEKLATGDGYLLVYSITDDTTFAKLDKVRDEVIKAHGGRAVPFILVGTKADLAGDRAVTERERGAKAKAWGCASFEVSAKTNSGVADAFAAVIEAVARADGSKGTGGGSVMGAGRTTHAELAAPARKRGCVIA